MKNNKNKLKKYTKEDLEKLLQDIPFIKLVKVGDTVTNKILNIYNDEIISKEMNGNVEVIICKESGMWTVNSPGWELDPIPRNITLN